MLSNLRSSLLLVALWVVLVAGVLYWRPLMLIDETRYVAVAWEMWHSGDYLVPHLNGEVYSHKPPLLFWLINAGWAAFGVREWVARIVSPTFGLLDLFAVGALARALWPTDSTTQTRVGAVLLSLPFFALYSTMLMFDAMLTLFLLIALIGVVRASRFDCAWYVPAYIAFGIGGGLLTKGPIVLLYLLPVLVLVPWWFSDLRTAWWSFIARVTTGILGGICIGLVWAIPASIAGGQEYREALLWTQTAGRIADSFAHERPIWFYLMFVPLILFPWLYWAPIRAAFRRNSLQDHGLRFCTAWFAGGFLVLCLISGKQAHYLLPLLPSVALFATRLMNAPLPTIRRPVFIAAVYAILGISALLAATRPVSIGNIALTPSILSILAAALLAIGSLAYLDRSRSVHVVVWGASIGCVALIVAIHVLAGPGIREVQDTTSVAEKLAALKAANRPVVHTGIYHGQFSFTGKITQPIPVAETGKELTAWCAKNPDGYVIRYWRGPRNPYEGETEMAAPFRGRFVGIVPAYSPQLRNELADECRREQRRAETGL